MYTNRWNLYKAKRLKAEPLCPFSQLGIYFTTSIEPAVSGWWRAKARPNFGAQLSRDSPNPCRQLPFLLTRPLLPLIDQIRSCHRQDLNLRLSSLSLSLCCRGKALEKSILFMKTSLFQYVGIMDGGGCHIVAFNNGCRSRKRGHHLAPSSAASNILLKYCLRRAFFCCSSYFLNFRVGACLQTCIFSSHRAWSL